MKILVVEPMKIPVIKEIKPTLSEMQKVVGGYIEALYPFPEPVALVCNEEGKLLGLPPNRVLKDEEGEIYDIVAGTFFLCSAPPDKENFCSLSDDEIEYFTDSFKYPEFFF